MRFSRETGLEPQPRPQAAPLPERQGSSPDRRLSSVEGVRAEIERRTRLREGEHQTRAGDREVQRVQRGEVVAMTSCGSRQLELQLVELEAARAAARRDADAAQEKNAALTRKIVEMKEHYHQRVKELETKLRQAPHEVGSQDTQKAEQRARDARATADADTTHALRALLRAREDQFIEAQAAAERKHQALRAEVKHATDELAAARASARAASCEGAHACSSCGAHATGSAWQGDEGVGLKGGVSVAANDGAGAERRGDGGDGGGEGQGFVPSQLAPSHVMRVLQDTLRELNILKRKAERERDARDALVRDYVAQVRMVGLIAEG